MAIHYIIISLLSLTMMVVVGMLLFHFNMRGDWLLFSLMSVISAMMMVGLGLLIGGWAKNENQSAPLSNLISFPMMFLSGAFFPVFLFPEWLRGVTQFIPMTPVVDIGAFFLFFVVVVYGYMIEHVPVAGGEYAYAYSGFKPTCAFICG